MNHKIIILSVLFYFLISFPGKSQDTLLGNDSWMVGLNLVSIFDNSLNTSLLVRYQMADKWRIRGEIQTNRRHYAKEPLNDYKGFFNTETTAGQYDRITHNLNVLLGVESTLLKNDRINMYTFIDGWIGYRGVRDTSHRGATVFSPLTNEIDYKTSFELSKNTTFGVRGGIGFRYNLFPKIELSVESSFRYCHVKEKRFKELYQSNSSDRFETLLNREEFTTRSSKVEWGRVNLIGITYTL